MDVYVIQNSLENKKFKVFINNEMETFYLSHFCNMEVRTEAGEKIKVSDWVISHPKSKHFQELAILLNS